MKFKMLAMLTMLGLACAAIAEDAGSPGLGGLRLTYDMAGMPVTVTRDAAGVVQFDGLPYPGVVLYVPATRTVYYQHPDEPNWLVVSDENIKDYGSASTLVEGAPWQPYLDAPTRRWEVKAAQMSCDNWFTSVKAASVTGLTVADLWRVFTTLQWLHAGSAAAPCDRLAVADAEGPKVGLPLYFNGPGGLWQLTELTQASVPAIPLPSTPQPVDDAARLRVLLHQFSPEDIESIMKEISSLPLARQVEHVQKMLAEQAVY